MFMSGGTSTDSMLDMYLYENGQLLEQLENMALDKRDEESFDESDINELFRIMHTIKGSSGVMMFDDIMKLSHKLEDIFYFIRESHPKKVPHLELVEHILSVSDFISSEFEKIKSGKNPDGNSTELVKEIDDFLSKIKVAQRDAIDEESLKENKDEKSRQFYMEPNTVKASNCFSATVYYRKDIMMCNIHAYASVYILKEKAQEVFYEPEDILTNEEASNFILEHGFIVFVRTTMSMEEVKKILDTSGVEKIDIGECDASLFPADANSNKGQPTTINLDEPMLDTEEKSLELSDYIMETKQPGKQKKLVGVERDKNQVQNYISVNVAKVDALIDLIGEIVIAQSVVLQNSDLQVPGLSLNNFKKAAAQLTKFTSEMQDVIMSMRMIPLTNVFQKMKRIIFDTSKKAHKETELVVIGENTEVDKGIIEHISDPLMHMIRNSVDHGIEDTKEERVAAGKPEKGIITLEARNEGGKVLIIVKDDGKGMNTTKLFEKAKKNGFIPRDKLESDYTKKEILQFITFPGFSTNKQITELSGRGVGMDIVMKNIQSIGGILDIESEEGKGSTMTMKIPLTLAIIEGILMKVGHMTFVLEMSVIKEFINVQEMNRIVEPNGEEYASIRGNFYPIIRLGDKYHIKDAKTKIEDGIIILAEYEKKQVCIFVDRLIGGQEIVVKPIPTYVKEVKGLSGCTQLGDGSIALILDIAGLFS